MSIPDRKASSPSTAAGAPTRSVGLPALPATVVRLLAALSKQDAAAEDIATVVESDTGLSARLLRLANAPAYGFPRRIRTVQHAVALLGSVVVRGLAVGGAVFDRGADTRVLWKHSYAVGLVARHLARGRKRESEDCFTAGLLHDVGSVVLSIQHAVEMRAVYAEAQERGVHHSVVEQEALGLDHADAGAALLLEWSLPQIVVDAVNFHHRPGDAGSSARQASLIHVADLMVDRLGAPSGYPGPPPMRPDAWRLLGLDGVTLDALHPEVERILQGLPSFD